MTKHPYPGAIEAILCDLCLEFAKMDRREQDGASGLALSRQIRLIGRTANFCGGFDAMKKLHDAAENAVGNDNSVGYWLNLFWDGIGGWWA